MTGTCRLNNKSMRNYRHTPEYQAILVDLTLLGIVSKEECEMILGSGIPTGLTLPNGKSAIVSSKPEVKKEEPKAKKEKAEKKEEPKPVVEEATEGAE